MAGREVLIDRKLCIGCGACTGVCEEVFEIKQDPDNNGEQKSFVKKNAEPEKYADKVEQAITTCPVTAISWK